ECFDEASITIDGLELVPATATASPATGTALPMTPAPVALTFPGGKTLNLLDLTGGVTESLGTIAAPPGSFDGVRVLVREGVLTWRDGVQRTFALPAGTGI